MIVLAIVGIFTSLDYPSEQKIIKRNIKIEDIPRASSITQARESSASLLGGPLAGFVYSISAPLVIFLQAIFNFFSTIISWRIKNTSFEDGNEEISEGILSNTSSGYKFIWKNRVLLKFTVISCIANITVTGIPLSLIYYYQGESYNEISIGLLNTIFGIGIILGSIMVNYLTKKLGLGTLGVLSVGVFWIGQLVCSFVYMNFIFTAVAIILSVVTLPSFNAALMTYTNIVTPDSHIASVTAAMGVPGTILMPIGALVPGFLYGSVGTHGTLLLFSIFSLFAFLIVVFSKDIRSLKVE